MPRVKNLLAVIGLTALVWFSLVMTQAFYAAYFSPAKSVLIKINEFNEANLEAVMLPICWAFMVFAVYHLIKLLNKEGEK